MSRADEQSEFAPESALPDVEHQVSNGSLPATTLTQRQREIAAFIAQGLTNEEIADRLVVSAGTVANHVASMLQRLAVGSRTQIATWAVEHGLSGSQDRLLTTLERLLEVQPTTLKAAMDEVASLIAEVLGAAKVDAFLHAAADVGHGAADCLTDARLQPGGHWAIENDLHYVRDVTLGEDASRIRSGTAPQAMAAIRNPIVAVLQRAGITNRAAAVRQVAWHPDQAAQALGLPCSSLMASRAA